MSVPVLSETRNYGRMLTATTDARIAGVKQNAFDNSPLMSVLFGKMTDSAFGPTKMSGKGKKTQDGGASVEVRHELGKNLTAKTLTGQWDTFDTTPQDNIRHSRANWVHYSSTATISQTEKLVQKGGHEIISILQSQVESAVNSLADLAGDHAYSNGSDATRVTSLQQIISAGDSLQGLSGVTYPRWNSRGLSARGTAPASVTFDGSASGTSDSFAAAGLVNLRTLYDNASEGMIRPHAGFTTYLLWAAYEASLQTQFRYTDLKLGDIGFANLAFDTGPVFKDPKCTAGEWYFINFDTLYAKVLSGADLDMSEFHPAEQQEAWSSHCMFKLQLVCENRYLNNKWVNATA